MNNQEVMMRISTDCAGGINSPRYAYSLNRRAGFQKFLMEGVGFPWLTIEMFVNYLAGTPLAIPLVGVHSRTGQLNNGFLESNSIIDLIKLGIAEPLLPDITFGPDLWMLVALKSQGMEGSKKYWLVHESEIDNKQTLKNYVKVFSREEFNDIYLYIENSPLPGSLRRTKEKVARLRDSGLKHVEMVGDTVHYLRENGIDPCDIKYGAKIWNKMILQFYLADIAMLHFSDGTDSGDSHNVLKMNGEGKMLEHLGDYVRENKIIFTRESQHGALGPANDEIEIERLKRIGEIELRSGLFSEKYFKMRV